MMQTSPPELGRRAKSQQPAQSSTPSTFGRICSQPPALPEGGERGGDQHSAELKVFPASCHTKQGERDKCRICRVSPCTKALAEAIASALLGTAQVAGRGDPARRHARERAQARRVSTTLPTPTLALQGPTEKHCNTGCRCRSSPALILAAEGTIAASAKQQIR